jgi:hypothetical protein
MTTPLYRLYRAKIAEINDQLCYSYFSDAQAHHALERASVEEPAQLTTTTFPDNPIAPRIRIRNGALPAFRARAIATMAGMAFMTATEHMLRYMSEIQTFRDELSPLTLDLDKDTPPEDGLGIRMRAWGHSIDDPLVKTIRYLRLRRNQIAHANEAPHQAFLTSIRNDGRFLQKYWDAQPTKLPGLNFSQKEASSFTMPESLSLLNLCYACLRRVDDAIIRSIPIPMLEAQQINRFIEYNKKLNGHTVEMRYSRFKKRFEQSFGLSLQCDLESFITHLSVTCKPGSHR